AATASWSNTRWTVGDEVAVAAVSEFAVAAALRRASEGAAFDRSGDSGPDRSVSVRHAPMRNAAAHSPVNNTPRARTSATPRHVPIRPLRRSYRTTSMPWQNPVLRSAYRTMRADRP